MFSLIILNADQTKTRQIETTLDPRQYITLYPLNTGETIAYVDTWMCRGRTDWLKPNCENPAIRAPAAAVLDQSPNKQ